MIDQEQGENRLIVFSQILGDVINYCIINTVGFISFCFHALNLNISLGGRHVYVQHPSTPILYAAQLAPSPFV